MEAGFGLAGLVGLEGVGGFVPLGPGVSSDLVVEEIETGLGLP